MTFLSLAFLALAQDTSTEGAAQGSSGLQSMMVPIILMVGIFYFVLIRPERKKQKDRETMLKAIKKGDRVMTTSGILAKVVTASDEEVKLEIADGVRVRFSRQAVQLVLDQADAKELEKQSREAEKASTSPA